MLKADRAILVSAENVQWLTGYRPHPLMQAVAVLEVEGDCLLIAPGCEPEHHAADTVRTFEAQWLCTLRQDQLQAAIRQIPDLVTGATFVQAEGGPTLNGALADADLLDEINVNTSPVLVGGSGPRLTSGATDLSHRFELAQLVIDGESFVFSRWTRRRTSP